MVFAGNVPPSSQLAIFKERAAHGTTQTSCIVDGRARSRPLPRTARAGLQQALHDRAARPDAGADRPLSRRAAVAGPDGCDLSAGGRRGGALVAGQSQSQGRRRRGSGEGQELGRQREVAGRVSADAADDEQPARLDPEAGRRDDRPAEGRRDRGPAPARQGGGRRQSEVDLAAEGDDAVERRCQCDRHRAGQSRSSLRSLLQPGLGLRRLALSGLSAAVLSATAQLRRGVDERHDVRPGRRRGCGDVRRLALGLWRRRLGQQLHDGQRQPGNQHHQ